MKGLLVKREPLTLEKRIGTVKIFKEMPDFLSQAPLFIHPDFIFGKSKYQFPFMPSFDDDIGIPNGWYSGVWSGERSALVEDPSTGSLYRLKGVAFSGWPAVYSNDEMTFVNGGQSFSNSIYEEEYSNRFNSVLIQNGFKPVMDVVGRYVLPFKVRGQNAFFLPDSKDTGDLAVTVARVLGDTRLDEFFTMIEVLRWLYMDDKKSLLGRELAHFYYQLGFKAGLIKKLMDRSGQTWSDNPDRTNAHPGNIVIYRDSNKTLEIGLVDFDASSDSRDMSKRDVKDQQDSEKKSIICYALDHPHSVARQENFGYEVRIDGELRLEFISGYIKGYSAKRPVNKPINSEPFDIFLSLASSRLKDMPFESVHEKFKKRNAIGRISYDKAIEITQTEFLEKYLYKPKAKTKVN